MKALEKDNQLVKRSLDGDIEAFSELVVSYQSRLYNFILKMSGSSLDAEEIVQEVFIKIYNNLYKYNDKYCFSTWVYTIALNTFKSEYKKKKRHSYQEIDESILRPDFDQSPENIYIDKENINEMHSVLNTLSLENKAILILKYADNLSYKEIGEISKISPDAAKMKIYRAKQTLCKKYGSAEKRGVIDEVQL